MYYYLSFKKDKDDGKSISYSNPKIIGEIDLKGDEDIINYYPRSDSDEIEITTFYPYFQPINKDI